MFGLCLRTRRARPDDILTDGRWPSQLRFLNIYWKIIEKSYMGIAMVHFSHRFPLNVHNNILFYPWHTRTSHSWCVNRHRYINLSLFILLIIQDLGQLGPIVSRWVVILKGINWEQFTHILGINPNSPSELRTTKGSRRCFFLLHAHGHLNKCFIRCVKLFFELL